MAKTAIRSSRSNSNYAALLSNSNFLRYALSQAFTLGGLLVFVFGAPTVITVAMGGDLADFVVMQVVGIVFFAISANLTDRVVAQLGAELTILAGSVMSAIGCFAILIYGLVGGNAPETLWVLFALVNLGLGVRGPPGFHQAIVAAKDNDARGSALVILFVLLTAAVGTAVIAPFIELGLVPLSAAASCVTLGSVLVLVWLRPTSQSQE